MSDLRVRGSMLQINFIVSAGAYYHARGSSLVSGMFGGGRAWTLDLFVKHVLFYRVEPNRIFSTNNASAITSWRQLKPRAPRKRKRIKEPAIKSPHRELAPENKSIQALESTLRPAQCKKENHESTNKTTEEKPKSKQSEKLPSFKFPPSKKATITDTGKTKKASEDAKSDDKDVIKNGDIEVDSRVDFSKWKFHNASYFGCTPGEVTQRMKELSQAGFCNDHIDLLLRRLPPTLQINSKVVHQNINSFIKWNIPWKEFIDTNPEILLLEPNQVFCYHFELSFKLRKNLCNRHELLFSELTAGHFPLFLLCNGYSSCSNCIIIFSLYQMVFFYPKVA